MTETKSGYEMAMTKRELQRLVSLATSWEYPGDLGGGPETFKHDWKQLGMKYLREIANRLDLKKGSFQVRFNAGGPAVHGESTLHSVEHGICVQVCGGIMPAIMFRGCDKEDPYGIGMNHHNNWWPMNKIDDMDGLVRSMKKVMRKEVMA